jgi:hypothetical protein
VDFNRVSIESDLYQFGDDCIQHPPTETALVLPPVPAPPSTPAGTYTIQYQAQWAIFEWQTASTCDYTDLQIIIRCDAGSTISFVSGLNETVSCMQSSKNELLCSDQGGNSATTALNFIDDFSGVIFVSFEPPLCVTMKCSHLLAHFTAPALIDLSRRF